MTEPTAPPAWKMPEGVNEPLWRYTHSQRLAEDEDTYFAGHPLFEADRRFLLDRFTRPGRLVDLGCGAGRLTVEFARRGFDSVAVDLSRPMLRAVGAKAEAEGLEIARVEANLCRLPFASGSFDHALLMFSTLGMVRGAGARGQAMREVARILRPGGRLALHAHNLWLNLHDPQGRVWLAGQAAAFALRRPDRGDRRMTYRGVAGMEVHLFHWRELRALIRGAGLRIEECLPIDAITARPIAAPGLLPSIRAGGWLIVAARPS